MSTNPPPSTLVFLTSLPRHANGTKVRFLGCVENYNVSTATLTLFHHFPRDLSSVRARVNVDLLLSSLKQTDTAIGEWVNVIGYINDSNNTARQEIQVGGSIQTVDIRVEAIMVWSAGRIKLKDYESVLQQRQGPIDEDNSRNTDLKSIESVE